MFERLDVALPNALVAAGIKDEGLEALTDCSRRPMVEVRCMILSGQGHRLNLMTEYLSICCPLTLQVGRSHASQISADPVILAIARNRLAFLLSGGCLRNRVNPPPLAAVRSAAAPGLNSINRDMMEGALRPRKAVT
jgi:hypothetical protein